MPSATDLIIVHAQDNLIEKIKPRRTAKQTKNHLEKLVTFTLIDFLMNHHIVTNFNSYLPCLSI